MKSALPFAFVVLAGVLVTLWLQDRGRGRGELLALRDTLATARAAHQRTDSLLAAAQAADSLRRAEDDRRVATSHTIAVSLGRTVTRLTTQLREQAALLVCSDSAGLDSLLRTIAALEDSTAAHLVADSVAAVAQETRHQADRARIAWLQTSAIPQLQAERDSAQARAERAVALGLRGRGHGWRTHAVLAGVAVLGTLLLAR